MAFPLDGLVLHYTMDNIIGNTVVDEMGNHHGVIVGDVQTVPGENGQALSFTGGYIDTGYKTNGGDYTIIAVVNRTTNSSQDAIYSEVNSTGNSSGSLLMFIAGDNIRTGHFKSIDSDWDVFDFPSPQPGEFHIYALVRKDGEYHKGYIDNVLIASNNNIPSVTNESSFTGKIGANPDNFGSESSRDMDGAIDNFLIYDRALTDEELTNIDFSPFVLGIDLTENLAVDEWNVGAYRLSDGGLSKRISINQAQASIEIPYIYYEPHLVTVSPVIGHQWIPNEDVISGQKCFPTDPITTPYYYRCTTPGTTGASEPSWPTDPPGALVSDGDAEWELVERMVQPITHGPLIPE